MLRDSLGALGLLATVLLAAATPTSARAETLQDHASYVCSEISATPALAAYEARFAASFREKVSQETAVSILKATHAELGACTAATLVVPPAQPLDWASFDFAVADGFVLDVGISVDADGQIDGLLLRGADDPSIQIRSFADLAAVLAALPGRTAAAFVDASPGVASAPQLHHPDEVLPTGSAFKLWVLGTLAADIQSGYLTWGTPLAIRDEWKSLPSGEMQNLPVGYAPSAFEYAQKMISISDNTATDHLIHYLGRDRVAERARMMGTAPHRGNDPFLTTLEMFKAKWGVEPARSEVFAAGDAATRHAMLEELAKFPREKVCEDGVRCTVPTYIHQIEWFATPKELCEAIGMLATGGSANVRDVLRVNVPFAAVGTDKPWSYAGYKGGSEPGVLNMTFWLERADGSRGCLSVSWADEAATLHQRRFSSLIEKALVALEGEIGR
jgi:beta-lactamase class A